MLIGQAVFRVCGWFIIQLKGLEIRTFQNHRQESTNLAIIEAIIALYSTLILCILID